MMNFWDLQYYEKKWGKFWGETVARCFCCGRFVSYDKVIHAPAWETHALSYEPCDVFVPLCPQCTGEVNDESD